MHRLLKLLFGKEVANYFAPNNIEYLTILVQAPTLDNCLRLLEIRAGLPKGDLALDEGKEKIVDWQGVGCRGKQKILTSRTSDNWRSRGMNSYVVGVVTFYSRSRYQDLVALPDALKDDDSYIGEISVKRNCACLHFGGQCYRCGAQKEEL